jgi:hypothetical protein
MGEQVDDAADSEARQRLDEVTGVVVERSQTYTQCPSTV